MAFVNIGHRVYLNTNEVLMVIPNSSGYSKSIRKAAREQGKAYSACVGEEAKSVLILKDGSIITSILGATKVAARINRGEYELLARLAIRYGQIKEDGRFTLKPEIDDDPGILRPLEAYEDEDDDDDTAPDTPYAVVPEDNLLGEEEDG